MNLGIYQQTNAVGSGNVLVATLCKASAPSTIVAQTTYTGPYTGQTQNWNVTGLLSVVYIYTLFESPDGLADGTIRNQFEIQPSATGVNVRADLYLQADVTSGFLSGQNAYVDTSLVGWSYDVERVGSLGTMFPYPTPGYSYQQDSAGGFHLTTTGDVFQTQEKVIVHFQPQITTAAPSPSQIFTTSRIITANTTLGSTDLGKAIRAQGSGSFLTITLPALSAIANDFLLPILSKGGSHIGCAIQCAGADKFEYANVQGGSNLSQIILGQNEDLEIFADLTSGSAPIWCVYRCADGVNRVGEILFGYSNTMLNTVALAGQTLSRTTYARLWNYIQSLGSGLLISDALWNVQDSAGNYTNRGKFTTGDGSSNFRLPQIYNAGGYISAGDGVTRAIGSFQADGVGSFNGSITGPLMKKSGTGNEVVVIGNINDADLSTGPSGIHPGVAAPLPIAGDSATGKTHPPNTALYALIRI